MTSTRLPVLFVSHGGGPWSYIDAMRPQYAVTERELKRVPATLPERPKAVLVITGHWQENMFTVSTAPHPPMEYDYSGFPEHTYRIQYKAPGSAPLAARVRQLLGEAGMASAEDGGRGFDHGTFVPLGLMFPQADVPIVLLSMKASYDADEHFAAGAALRSLRAEGVLIVGSGLTYHNMRGFGRPEAMAVSVAFEAFLNEVATTANAAERQRMLHDWEDAPGARLAHPREDHLLPFMVAAGAAGDDPGARLYLDKVMNVVMASYRFGA